MSNLRAVIRKPGVVALEEGPDLAPGPGELLIAPDVVGVCGTDIELLDGTMGYFASGKASYPLVPGHEWTGIVQRCGEGVDGFSAGDRVVGETSVGCGHCDRCLTGAYHVCEQRTETGLFGRDGALATQLVHPARATYRLAPTVGWRDAVLIEPLAVAHRALGRANVLPARVAVLGGGTIGHACALVVRALGDSEVSVIERDAVRRDLFPSLLYRDGTAPDAWPLVLEATGSPAGLAAAVELCDDGGTVVALGLTGQDGVFIDADAVVLRDLTIKGSLSSAGSWPDVIELVSNGKIEASPLVSDEFPLEAVAEAFERVRTRPPGTFKVVIHPNRTERQ